MRSKAFLILSAILTLSNVARAQEWMSLDYGVYIINGVQGTVNSLLYDSAHNILIVSGEFAYAGDLPCDNIVFWNGNEWKPYGTGGVPFEVNTLIIDQDTLLIAGDHSYILEEQVNSDGSVVSLGSIGSFNDEVLTMVINDDDLIAGGRFSKVSGQDVNGIARWNGAQWAPMSEGFSGSGEVVYDLVQYNGETIAAGYFERDAANNNLLNNIARWDGISWQPLGLGLSDNDPNNYMADVKSIEVFNGELYASGDFTYINGNEPVNHFAKWNGTIWTSVGDSIYALLNDMKVYKGKLYGVHDFEYSFGSNAAVFDGESWQSLGLGNVGTLYTLEIFDDTLYVGGSLFLITSTGDTARNIAALDLNSVPTSTFEKSADSQLEIYPNPAFDYIFVSSEAAEQTILEIRDGLGRIVSRSIFKSNHLLVDISDLVDGIYFVEVQSRSDKLLGKFVKSSRR